MVVVEENHKEYKLELMVVEELRLVLLVAEFVEDLVDSYRLGLLVVDFAVGLVEVKLEADDRHGQMVVVVK